MNRSINQEQLVKKILEFGRQASEHLQISKRLRDLLPDRMKKIGEDVATFSEDSTNEVGDEMMSVSSSSPVSSISKSRRGILVSNAYKEHVEELIEIRARGLEARIQYETHVMLFEGRRTLESLHKAQKFGRKSRF